MSGGYQAGRVFRCGPEATSLHDRPWFGCYPGWSVVQENDERRVWLRDVSHGEELEVVRYCATSGAVLVCVVGTKAVGWLG